MMATCALLVGRIIEAFEGGAIADQGLWPDILEHMAVLWIKDEVVRAVGKASDLPNSTWTWQQRLLETGLTLPRAGAAMLEAL